MDSQALFYCWLLNAVFYLIIFYSMISHHISIVGDNWVLLVHMAFTWNNFTVWCYYLFSIKCFMKIFIYFMKYCQTLVNNFTVLICQNTICMFGHFISMPDPPEWTGLLSANNHLTKAERVFEGQLNGPESIACDGGKFMFLTVTSLYTVSCYLCQIVFYLCI